MSDVGHREVLGEPERMPHRRDVEPTAEAQPARDVGKMDGVHQHVGDALVALVLEVVLGQPEGVVAHPVHELRHGLGLVEHGDEALVGEAAVVHRGAAVPDVVHVDVASEQAVELRDHVVIPVGVMVSAPDCTAGPTGAAGAARWDSSSAGYRRTSPR